MLVARLTRRSVHDLELRAGALICAQVKTVALIG
jgi:ABC-type molybdate transport system ATPase subunit